MRKAERAVQPRDILLGFDILGTSSIAGITEAEAEVHN